MESKLIPISLLFPQNQPHQIPRIVFQCVNTDTLRILSVRLVYSRDRFYFSRGNQIPSRHPQAVQNLLHARRGTIHSVPIDVPGVGLSAELVALYWNAQARQFIFRGVELLADHAELDWFANAPVRREAAIARRLATRAANQQARQQAILARIQQAQNMLNRVRLPNVSNQNQPPRGDPSAASNEGNPPAPPPPRRPTFRRASNADYQSTRIENSSSQVLPQSSQAPESNHQPPPIYPVYRRIRQLNNSTPIVRRSIPNQEQPPNLRDEIANVSNVTFHQLFNDRPDLVISELQEPVVQADRVANQTNLIASPNEQAGPSGVQQENAGEASEPLLVNHSASAMEIENQNLARNSSIPNNNTTTRKRQRRPNASSDSTL